MQGDLYRYLIANGIFQKEGERAGKYIAQGIIKILPVSHGFLYTKRRYGQSHISFLVIFCYDPSNCFVQKNKGFGNCEALIVRVNIPKQQVYRYHSSLDPNLQVGFRLGNKSSACSNQRTPRCQCW